MPALPLWARELAWSQTLVETLERVPGWAGGSYRTLLWLAWKWQHGDVSRHTGGDLAAALGRITARTTVVPISTDLFFPGEDVAAEQARVPGGPTRATGDRCHPSMPSRRRPASGVSSRCSPPWRSRRPG